MLVLLPPSEGKADPIEAARGGASRSALDLGTLSLPGLTAARAEVLAELVELCSADAVKAREVLGLSEGLKGEVAKNAGLRTAGTRPAGEIYTGVLYDALGLASLDAAAHERAARSLLVFSGLWGAVRIDDRIPSYRCSMGVKLPGLGALGAYWRGPMAEVLPEAAASGGAARSASGRGGGRATGGLVLDLRSAAYATAWKPKGELAERTATVRVLQSKIVNGVEKRSVVSHFNKATKGRLVRDLLVAGAEPADPAELVETLRGLGYAVEAQAPAKAGKPWALDVIVTEL
ncbi:peroxide stress protein YaaA [Streptomyces sp. BHT-5-2]|uniref:peroxide stress protein YaaA n=1 Tax=unclassified Streptomyces TaxID=2593676 RepID=UPI001C8F0EE9|nr:peroxide stress protein YaaA [Streptomyces sp. BHT-5-2]QZL06423.1 peroxide stress protein YaaA [Streptomyces sp. BHT-5-2]